MNRYQEYCERYQCSLQEAKRVLKLEDRIKALTAIRNDLGGSVYHAEVVAEKVVQLIDLLLSDAEAEYRR